MKGFKHIIINYEITQDNVGQFEIPKYRRNIRERSVERIVTDLHGGETLKNPLHVNLVNNKYRVIDGNHRIEGIKVFLNKGYGDSVSVPLAIYKNLSPAEETYLYDVLARTVNQTINDLIKIHFDEIPIFKSIAKWFPVNVAVYSKTHGVTFSQIVTLWENRNRAGMFNIPRKSFLDRVQKYTLEDYNGLKEFFSFYKYCFGNPEVNSPYYRTGPLWIVCSIYHMNKTFVPGNQFWGLIKTKLFNNYLMLEAARTIGRQSLSDRRKLIVEKLNEGWRGNKLI